MDQVSSSFLNYLTTPDGSLEHSEAQLRTIFDHTDQGLVVSDLNGHVLFWNRAALSMYGLTCVEEGRQPAEKIAEHLEFTKLEESTAVSFREFPFQRILRGESLCNVEFRVRHKEKNWRKVFSYGGTLVRNEAGLPIMALLTITDVTERKELEEQLRLRTQELQTIMEVAPVAIFVSKDPNCDNIVGNPTANIFTESEPGENISVNHDSEKPAPPARRFFHEGRELDPSEHPMQAAAAGNRDIRNAEVEILLPSGRRISLLGSASPMRNGDGQVRGAVAAFLDITSRKEAERAIGISEQRLRSILDTLFVFVALLTPEGIVQEINRAPLEAAGIRREDVLGTPFDEAYWWSYSPVAQARIREAMEAARRGEVSRFDVDVRIIHGQIITVDFMLAPLRDADGVITGLLPSAVEVTKRKQMECALVRKTEELSRVNRELEAFSYSVSHDLRTPLRAINGFNGALLEEFGALLPEEGHKYLERVHAATIRMGELVDGLLNLSQVLQSDLQLSEVDMTALACGIAESLQEEDHRRKVHFTIEPDLVARGDPALMRVLLENLFLNAWKFTERRGEGRIEFGRRADNARDAFYVRDNGAGFDMQFAHRLFQPFERLHKHGEFAGNGIGLATVRRIVERHGGQVWAEAGIDKGATIFFCFGRTEIQAHEKGPG